MGNIFISYRREDSQHITDRIFDHLVRDFDRRTLFKDVDNIPIGVNFRTHLDAAVAKANLMLAIIGPTWSGATAPDGKRRLYDPNDFVAIEIGSAIKRGCTVVPVLVGGAKMPGAHELPEPLKELALINAVQVRPDPDFSGDYARLSKAIKGLDQGRGSLGSVRTSRWPLAVAAGVVVVAGLAAITWVTLAPRTPYNAGIAATVPPVPASGAVATQRPPSVATSNAPPAAKKNCHEYSFTDTSQVPPVYSKRWDCD